MHGPVIDVTRHCLNGLTLIIDTGVSLRFLFVADVICETSLVVVPSFLTPLRITYALRKPEYPALPCQ